MQADYLCDPALEFEQF